MLTKSPISAAAYQWAAYTLAARLFHLTLRPPRLDHIKRYGCDVIDLDATIDAVADGDTDNDTDDGEVLLARFFDRAALVMLVGTHALQRFAPQEHDRGDLKAREYVWETIEKSPGFIMANRSAERQFNARIGELNQEYSDARAWHTIHGRTNYLKIAAIPNLLSLCVRSSQNAL